MDDSKEELIGTMTDKELKDHFVRTKKYSALEIDWAAKELRKRGKFNEQKYNRILKIIKRKLIEDDPNIPTYYSHDAIFIFSILFSAVFGSILLAFNVKDHQDKWIIIGFGITYTVFMFTMATIFKHYETLPIHLLAVGGILLTGPVWGRFIGKDIQYKNKPIWKPAIFAIACWAIFIKLYLF